ncbi:hypothetical protein CLAVI_000425 [Candidatus Clavichlamydia salmonicola]|nr:hypothetical protein [Candidatus Clavichlamydia salmonicola]
MITRFIVAIKNLLQLNRSEKDLTKLIIDISDKTLFMTKMQSISDAATATQKVVNSPRVFQKASIAGAVITLLGIIGLATVISLSLTSIWKLPLESYSYHS